MERDGTRSSSMYIAAQENQKKIKAKGERTENMKKGALATRDCIELERVPSRSTRTAPSLLPSWATENVTKPTETISTPCSTTSNAPPTATTTENRPGYAVDLLAYARRIGVKLWTEGGRLRWVDPNGESDPCEGLDDALEANRDALIAILEREQAETSSDRERTGSFFATKPTTTLRSL